jgi:dephospho-CoA kinase
MDGVTKSSEKVVFLDIPLALEQLENLRKCGLRFEEIWLVYVNSEIQRDRLRIRAIRESKIPEDVLKIMEKQTAIEKKVDMVDEVINNEGTLEDLRRNINELLAKKGFV